MSFLLSVSTELLDPPPPPPVPRPLEALGVGVACGICGEAVLWLFCAVLLLFVTYWGRRGEFC